MRRFAHLVLALAAAVPLQAQEILLRLNPRDGTVTQYLMTVETFSPGGALAQATSDTTLPLFRATLWQTQTISDLTEEEFTLTQVLDSIQIDTPALPMLAGMAGETDDLMRGMVTVTRMTRQGATRHVDMRLPEAMEGNILAQALQSGVPGVDGSGGIGSQMYVPFPERAVQVGETWLDSLALSLPASGPDSSGTATLHTSSTLRRLDGPVAVIAVEGRYHLADADLPGPMTLTMTSELTFDLEAGHLVGMTSEISGSTQGPTGDIPVRVLISSTTR